MGVQWTEEQEKVIRLRDRNILVSAAAGSGKTAVLVERIRTMLLDPAQPLDIDRLLIVTFTKAAAGEMKSRISQALEEALEKEPHNEHLQKQITLIHNAQITTIDGFCSYVIRNYFHLIGLDPGYRTADEGELKLLKTDVVRRLLEDAHQEAREGFLGLADAYAPGKTDEGLEGLVLKLYEFSTSAPWPREWLKDAAKAYEADTEQELEGSSWMQLLWEDTKKRLEDMQALAEENLELCLSQEGPYPYEEAARSDLHYVQSLIHKAAQKEFDAVVSVMKENSWLALSRKKGEGVSLEKKEQMKENREILKKSLGRLEEKYFSQPLGMVLETMKLCRKPMEELVRLTLEFEERFSQAKRQKNLLDFSDMEHFALDILASRQEDKTLVPSQAARELSEKYEEILIDEYQDSNQVQETILNLVSGWTKGKKNIFMVGDVKQSIYRFRLAKPELFMEKFHTYTLEDSQEQRIDLSRNFRSRHQVLDSVNYLFSQIMGSALGKVEYDKAAALYPGAQFPEGNWEGFPVTEVLLVEKDAPEMEDEKTIEAAREAEALAIAQRIRQMAGRELVWDKELQAYRPARYGDMVILLRTVAGWADEFVQVLGGQGIPAYAASKTGYFSALEVVTVLNYLRICDNPRQDIPLASVLHSPMVGCTAQELALLKTTAPECTLYEQVCRCLEADDSDPDLKHKLKLFWEELEDFRDRVPYTPIHQLILYMLEKTGYQNYVSALPAGEQRRANLNMLVEKAMEFEQTSYRGLFNFVRYIEQLQKYSVDFGEVNLSGGEQTVQILSIHKSKGLEFPIVFVAGMGKRFNLQDVNAGILIHPDYGIGADVADPKRRIRCTTLIKQVMQQQLLEESLGEELRVLYVALTRAKEKLILTGTLGKMEALVRKLNGFTKGTKALLPFTTLFEARDYWGWVLPALARHRAMEPLYREYGFAGDPRSPFYGREGEFFLDHVRPIQLIGEEISRQSEAQVRRKRLENWDIQAVYDQDAAAELKRRFSFHYPYAYLKEIPVKMSVSELKKRSYAEEDSSQLYFEPDIIPLIPKFIETKEEEFTGAARGTAYHRVLECLDYSKVSSQEEIRAQLQELKSRKKLKEKEFLCADSKVLYAFTQSSTGKRMAQAFHQGLLKREQPFVISQPAGEIRKEWGGDETVLIQGIIDAYFFEEDGIVIVDYKTDQVREGQEQKLLDLYQVQLQYYARALEKMTGRRVKEKLIYSITLQKEIPVP